MQRFISTLALSCLLVGGLAAGVSSAQLAVSTARGQVVDQDGAPVVGAKVIFWAISTPDREYTGKTNKKGRYSVSGLYTAQERDRWSARVEHEGFVAVQVVVESRNAQKVLAGEIMTQKLKPGQTVSAFGIRPLGTAKVDFTLAPESEVLAQAQNEAVAAASGEPGAEGQAAAPKRDPWGEAVAMAGESRLEDSVPFFEEAVADAPEDAERHETFAKVLYRLERYDGAEREARAAAELEPARIDSWLVLSSVYAAREQFEQAAEVLASASEAAPDNLRILERRAMIAKRLGKQDEARTLYKQITELDPSNAGAWLALGDYFAESGDSAASEAAFQKAVALDPSNAHQIYYNLGALIMNRDDRSKGDTQRAIDALRRATEIKPDYGEAHRQLAFALLDQGDRSGAAASLEAYVKASPNSADAAQMQGLAKSLRN